MKTSIIGYKSTEYSFCDDTARLRPPNQWLKIIWASQPKTSRLLEEFFTQSPTLVAAIAVTVSKNCFVFAAKWYANFHMNFSRHRHHHQLRGKSTQFQRECQNKKPTKITQLEWKQEKHWCLSVLGRRTAAQLTSSNSIWVCRAPHPPPTCSCYCLTLLGRLHCLLVNWLACWLVLPACPSVRLCGCQVSRPDDYHCLSIPKKFPSTDVRNEFFIPISSPPHVAEIKAKYSKTEIEVGP